jgi:hypothetical protein
MKPRAFGAITGGKTLPCFWIEVTGDLLSGTGDQGFAASAASAPLDWLCFEACCVCEKVSSFIWRFAWQMMDLLVAHMGNSASS